MRTGRLRAGARSCFRGLAGRRFSPERGGFGDDRTWPHVLSGSQAKLKGAVNGRPVVGARRGWAGGLRVSRGGLRGAASLAPRRVLAEPGAEGGQTRPPAHQRRGKGHHGAPRPSSGAACEASSSWETRTGCCAGPRGPAPPPQAGRDPCRHPVLAGQGCDSPGSEAPCPREG